MISSRLQTSRARLLAILLAVMLPIAAIMTAAAWTNYQFTKLNIDRDYSLLTSNYVSRLRVWMRGTERALTTAAASIAAIASNPGECQTAVRNVVERVGGYKALYLRTDSGASCSYAAPETGLDSGRLARLIEASAAGMSYLPVGQQVSTTKIYFEASERQDVIFHAVLPPKGNVPGVMAMLLVDQSLLNATIAFGEAFPGATVAAVLPDRRIVAIHGTEKGDRWWSRDQLGNEPVRWRSAGLDGVERVFASRPVISDGLYILGAFSTADLNKARSQFLMLLALPIMVIAALSIAFLRAIDIYVIRWLKQLEWTARERGAMRDARVKLSPQMPSEVHSFARAFNDMADAEASRRTALEQALDENRFLVRELHHRVKNSLQVIQSYLALERREKQGPEKAVLSDAELRVQLLSLAYRVALADGTIRTVDLGNFLGQMLNTAASQALGKGQIVLLEPPRHAAHLELEKVIALGFLVADLLKRAANAAPQFILQVRLVVVDGMCSLTAEADRPMTLDIEPRITRGLMLQLEASHIRGEPGTGHLGGWRWKNSAPAA